MTIHVSYISVQIECLAFLYVVIWFCVIDELHCQDIRVQNEDSSDRQNITKSSVIANDSTSCVITSVSLTKKRGKILSPSSKCHEIQ